MHLSGASIGSRLSLPELNEKNKQHSIRSTVDIAVVIIFYLIILDKSSPSKMSSTIVAAKPKPALVVAPAAVTRTGT